MAGDAGGGVIGHWPSCRRGAGARSVQRDAPSRTIYCSLTICIVNHSSDKDFRFAYFFVYFSEFVHPVCLPAYKKFTSFKYDRSMFEVAGWGIMDIGKYYILINKCSLNRNFIIKKFIKSSRKELHRWWYVIINFKYKFGA